MSIETSKASSEETNIQVGQIWVVVSDTFYTTKHKETMNRHLKIDKGEKIEIRYAYEWWFRTIDNHYLNATPEMIKQNARLFGVIDSQIRWKNKAKLEEILRLELYEPVPKPPEANEDDELKF